MAWTGLPVSVANSAVRFSSKAAEWAGKPSASLTRGCSSPTQPVKTSPTMTRGGAAGVPLDWHIVGGGLVEFDCGTDTAGDAAHGLDGVGPVDRALAAHPAVVLGQTGQDAGHMVGLFGQTGVKRGELFVGGAHAAGSAGMAGAFGSHR